jgi:CRP-like cAMP-binding protein
VRPTVLLALPAPERRRLLAAARRRRFAPGEVVFHEGDLGDSLHVVTRGHAAVRSATPRGDVLTLGLLGPGDQFGELSLLRRDHRHTATVVALDELATLCLGRQAFESLCRQDPSAALALAHLLATNVERLGHLLTEAYFLPASRRIARRLWETTRTFHSQSIPITQHDLADLAGTSRPTANEVLRDLQRRGVVDLDRHSIAVIDAEALRAAGRW